jgi:hypothetical protein
METVDPLTPVTATICPRERFPFVDHPSHHVHAPSLPLLDTKLELLVSAITRYIPVLIPEALLTEMLVDPEVAPPVIFNGL